MAVQMSMVLCKEAASLDASHVLKALAESWKELPAATAIESREDTLSFRIADVDVVIGVMPAPVPWSDLEGPCATSILWPNAAATLKAHRAHFIVTVRGELPPVGLATWLTRVTAAVLMSTPAALGVFWTNAALLIPGALFRDFATDILPHGPPLTIWVDFRVGWVDASKTRSVGFTQGLGELGLMELETEAATESPTELRQRFEAIAGYLLTNGPVIKDGDTLGESAAERILVRYGPSGYGSPGTVMHLVHAAKAVPKSPWKFWKKG
jgi:hypothetical protein